MKDNQYRERKKAFEDWLKEQKEYYVLRYPNKILSKKTKSWLKKESVAQCYINTKVIEYYKSGQQKMVLGHH